MEPITRYTENLDWAAMVIFGSLILVVLAKKFFYARFLNFIILPFNNKYILMYNKKEKLFNWFHLLLTAFQIINVSLFAYLSWRNFGDLDLEDSGVSFLIIFSCYFFYMGIKLLLQMGNGFIFGSFSKHDEILFKTTSYFNYSSLVLFLANILLAFVYPHSTTIIVLALILFLIINIIGWVTVVRIHQNYITSYFFYFILYLCALEIAPLIVLGSFLK